jgi:methionyl-tRNA synthetase
MTAESQQPDAKAFYVTTPIYYVNAAPHVGSAYTTIAGDVLTRWHRQRGEKAYYLTGTDEHGQKILRTAQQHGSTPQQWTDKLVEEEWKPLWAHLNIANDDFIRTTEPRHKERVQEFWQRIHDAGEVYQGSYEGPYCVGCEEFKLPGELVDGTGEYAGAKLCPVHGTPVEMLVEQNYFFRMSAYTDRLLAHYAEHPDFVEPASARNEVLRFVEQGLQDLSISRSTFDWGIPIPWDSKHVLYVWIDALLNYVTAVGYGADEEKFASIWPADVHLVGKDILRFHAVIWPAMLMAAGLPLPRKVFAHGWLMVGGEKMSKSKVTGIEPTQITGTFGVDALRYYLLRAIPFGQDGSFSWEDLAARYTSELANDFGNLASRVAAMIGRYYEGTLPEPGEPTDAERAVADGLAHAVDQADRRVEQLDLQGAIEAVLDFVKQVNGYVTEQQPWSVAKRDDAASRQRLATILYTAAEALRGIAVLWAPVMPATCETLWTSLGAVDTLGPLAEQRLGDAGRWGQLPSGAHVTKTEALFPRVDADA